MPPHVFVAQIARRFKSQTAGGAICEKEIFRVSRAVCSKLLRDDDTRPQVERFMSFKGDDESNVNLLVASYYFTGTKATLSFCTI